MSALEAMLLIQLSVIKILSATPCGKGGIADDLAYCPLSTTQQTITAHSPKSTTGCNAMFTSKTIVNTLKQKKSEGGNKTRKV